SRALAQWPESPVTAGRPRGKSDPGPSRQGELLDTAGYQSRARVARESSWMRQNHGPETESPGTVCQRRGHQTRG
ncbi:hypothetical protein C0984_19790, partial [Clostridioides difficile]